MAQAQSEWLYDTLRRIERRPGIYFGAEDVRTLQVYLTGCVTGRNDAGRTDDLELLALFGEWLRASTKSAAFPVEIPGTVGWSEIVELIDPTPKNIQTFYRLFRRFLIESGLRPL